MGVEGEGVFLQGVVCHRWEVLQVSCFFVKIGDSSIRRKDGGGIGEGEKEREEERGGNEIRLSWLCVCVCVCGGGGGWMTGWSGGLCQTFFQPLQYPPPPGDRPALTRLPFKRGEGMGGVARVH